MALSLMNKKQKVLRGEDFLFSFFSFAQCKHTNIIILNSLSLILSYSKHPHIRTLISGLRLIVFLFKGCLVRNQPESVLKICVNRYRFSQA